jgi:hypothetical protein
MELFDFLPYESWHEPDQFYGTTYATPTLISALVIIMDVKSETVSSSKLETSYSI